MCASYVCREQVDPISKLSLATRVCNSDHGLAYSSQASTFEDIDRYTDRNNSGVLLLVLCLFTWLNSVIGDISNALRVISAVCSACQHIYRHTGMDLCTTGASSDGGPNRYLDHSGRKAAYHHAEQDASGLVCQCPAGSPVHRRPPRIRCCVLHIQAHVHA